MTMNGVDDADDDPRRPHIRLSQEASRPSENWDDDFEFQPHATGERHGERDATHASQSHAESWDDAYEDDDPDASPVKRAPKPEDDDVEDWDSSDNEAGDEHGVGQAQNFIDEPLRELGVGFEEEDKTVTARSSSSRVRVQHAQSSQHPPLPPLFPFLPPQHQPPPTSPTLSSFSIPISSHRASVYSNDPLMPTASNGSAPHLSLPPMRAYPQSAGSTPPRKGRRLRKKSRPPEADIFELEDREPDPLPDPEVPVTPPAPPSPPRPATPPTTSAIPVAQPTPSPSLLTRIGSLKRWARRSVGPEDPAVSAFRRGKSSTGPSEIGRQGKSSTGPSEMGGELDESLEHELRTVSPTPAPGGRARLRRSRGDSASGMKAGWFFRAGGGGAEREDAPPPAPASLPARTPDPSPSKPKRDKEAEATPTPKKSRSRLVPVLRTTTHNQVQSQSLTQPHPQPPPSPRSPAKPSRESVTRQFPRHLGSASMGRSAGAPLSAMMSETPPQEENGVLDGKERDSGGGVRALMNGVRRLSLVNGTHKRTKSTGGDGAMEVPGRGSGASTGTSRPRSRGNDGRTRENGDDRPVSRASGPRPGSRASAITTRHELLPPIELDSPPSSAVFARRGSLPWAGYGAETSPASIPTAAVKLAAPAPSIDTAPAHSTKPSPLAPYPPFTPPIPSSFPPTPAHRQSFSASATSLLTSSPTKPQPQPNQQPPLTPQRLQPPPLPSGSLNTPQAPASPRTASLGRSTASPVHAGLRRNSLGDLKIQTPPRGELKIPARISRAQHGLRRDMGMVREFAASVEHLKRLQGTYTSLIGELRAAYDASPLSPSSRPTSPPQFHLPSRPPSQAANYPSPPLTSPSTTALASVSPRASHDVSRELVRLDTEYGIWWECAELLVELGGGSVAGTGTASNPNLNLAVQSASALNTPAEEPFRELLATEGSGLHVASMSEPGSIFEHALVEASTAKGPPQASPPQWRASTGRHDLSARQLRLLKDMLSMPDPASLAYAAGPYGYGSGYPPSHSYPVQEGEAWAPWNPSTVTLPSEESSTDPHASYSRARGEDKDRDENKDKKRRASRLGMLGLREILRGLKRSAVAEGRLDGAYQHGHGVQGSESSASASNSAEDDHYNRRRSPWHHHDEHHGGKQTPAPELSPALEVPALRNLPPKSPRRPSLASIFRIGQKSSKNGSSRSKEQSSSGNGNSTTEEEPEGDIAMGEYSDWDRMSRSDLDLPTAAVGLGTATVRGKKKPPPSNPNLLQSHSLPTVNMSATPTRFQSASQTSLRDVSSSSGTPSRLPLSIAEEGSVVQNSQEGGSVRLKKGRTPSWSQAHTPPLRPTSRNGKAAISGTVRSAPPTDLSSMPDPKLALTPENIKPLLEYAKEVSMRLGECVGEVQALLSKAA